MHALQNHAVRRTVAMLTTQHLLRKDELSSNYKNNFTLSNNMFAIN